VVSVDVRSAGGPTPVTSICHGNRTGVSPSALRDLGRRDVWPEIPGA
jgi:hypothetical protein